MEESFGSAAVGSENYHVQILIITTVSYSCTNQVTSICSNKVYQRLALTF